MLGLLAKKARFRTGIPFLIPTAALSWQFTFTLCTISCCIYRPKGSSVVPCCTFLLAALNKLFISIHIYTVSHGPPLSSKAHRVHTGSWEPFWRELAEKPSATLRKMISTEKHRSRWNIPSSTSKKLTGRVLVGRNHVQYWFRDILKILEI